MKRPFAVKTERALVFSISLLFNELTSLKYRRAIEWYSFSRVLYRVAHKKIGISPLNYRGFPPIYNFYNFIFAADNKTALCYAKFYLPHFC